MEAKAPHARLCLALVALTTAHTAVAAGVDLLDLSIEELANLAVTSVSRVEERLGEAPAAVFVITRDEIRRAGVTTIAEALRLAPGVEVARRNAHAWSITIRGFNSDLANKLLVLIDGRSVYSPLYAGVFWDVQDTLLEDIDRIEVIAGPGGTLWGANAVNGVINIITRPATATTGAFLELGGGKEEEAIAGFRYGGQIGAVAARTYVKVSERDSFKGPSGEDGADAWRLGQAGFRLDWAARDTDRWTLQGDFYSGNAAGIFEETFTLGTLPAGSAAGKADLHGANVLARFERSLGDGAELSVQSYVDHTRRDIPNTYDERRDTFDVDFQHRLRRAGRHDLLWGAGYRLTDDDIANSAAVVFSPATREDSTWSGFLQDKIAFLDERLFLTLGAKFAHNDYTGFESQPNARFSWLVDERRTVWAAVSRAVRIPARLDADLKLTVPLGQVVVPLYVTADGSRTLDSEELVAYEAGYRWRTSERLSFDFTLFRHDYDSLQTVEPGQPVIVLTPPAYAILPHRLDGLLTGTVTGGTFVANWEPVDRWRLRFQYTAQDMDLERKPGSADTSRFNEQGNSPDGQAAVYSFVDLPHDVEIFTGVRYVGELPNQAIDGYVAVNAGVGWSPAATLQTSLTLENANDSRHGEFGQANQIERSAFVRVRWTF